MKKTIICILTLLIAGLISAQGNITLENIWKSDIYYEEGILDFRFMNDKKSYVILENRMINVYDIVTGKKVKTLFDSKSMLGKSGFDGNIDEFSFSTDEKYVLIASEKEHIYRRSSKSHYFLLDRNTGDFIKIFDGNKQMYATLSPDGTKVAFVVDNDLYYRKLPDGLVTRVTHDGKVNEIINGASDWVYEEEFELTRAFQWSPGGSNIAFIRFDERQVPEFTMTNYRDDLYPEYVTFKYPKVGEKNAEVTVNIFNLKKNKTFPVNISNIEYIPRLKWAKNKELVITTLNRHQNHLQLWRVNSQNGQADVLLDEKNKYFINLHDHLEFINDKGDFIWMSEKNGFNQVFIYDQDGNEKTCLTPGKFDVTKFYGVDLENETCYFQAADNSPMSRNVYRVSLKGKKKEKISKLKGWNEAQFSKTYDYCVFSHSTANTPSTHQVFDKNGKLVRDIEMNNALNKLQGSLEVSPVEFFQFKTLSGTNLNGYMIKPSNFDKKKKYPVFMYQYGGPNSQQVVDRWLGPNYWWFQLLVNEGYIVACVDNRGTGARGEEFRKMTYMKLGHYEAIDQIEAARYLGRLPYIDADRIGIYGWSYGGYMSSLCLFKGNDVFKMGIAVAPVTNWKWYDTIYTERYMRTEFENPDGYRKNSPVYFADQLKGKYLLVHGGADDNVHVQNSMEMSSALIAANKQFDFYYYPNNNHSINFKNARLHLFQKMTDFILENL